MTGGVSALPMQIRLENKRVDGDGGHIATRILSWAHGGPPCEGHNPAHGVTKPKARVCGRVRRQLGRYRTSGSEAAVVGKKASADGDKIWGLMFVRYVIYREDNGTAKRD